VSSQNLDWTNKACYREEVPLGSLGLKKLATSESSLTKLGAFQLLKTAEAKLCHAITVTNYAFLCFIQIHLVKVKLPEKLELYKSKHSIISCQLSQQSNKFGIKHTVNNK
jgi:hypothetical protein